MATTTVTPAPDQQPAKIGAMGRVVGVLFNPGATYQDIARKPSWFAPLVILTLMSLGVCYFLVQKVDWVSFQRRQIEKSSFTSSLTEDQKEQAVARNAKFSPMITWCIGLLGPVISALIFTLIYWGGFNILKGAGIRFGTAFSITCYALVPAAVGAILTIVILAMKHAGDVDPERLAATSLGAFLPTDAPKWQIAIGSSLDLIWFWTLALLATGYAAANPRKITTSGAYGVVIGLWLVWVIAKVGLASIF